MSFNAIFNGSSVGTPPTQFPASAATVADGVDTSTGAAWNTAKGGWAPQANAYATNAQLALTGEPTSVVFTAPVTGFYRVDVYEISTVATSGDMPAAAVAFTDGNTGGSASVNAIASAVATSAANTVGQGSAIIHPKAGTTVTISGSGYSSTTYNFCVRVEYLG